MSSPQSCALSPRACGVCRKQEDLIRCPGCLVVYYCGRDHQAIDRKLHEEGCTKTEKALARLEKEEQTLRDHPGGMFENGVGRFFKIKETRQYMIVRKQVVTTLLQSFGAAGGRADAVRTALDHILDMLRLGRGDYMGVRDVAPTLFIRLNRDQEAYDFAKWYATTGNPSHCAWDDLDLPFLDIKGADVLEPPMENWANSRWIKMIHVVAVILIKVRVLLDLQAAINTTRALQGSIPEEMIGLICEQIVGSTLRSRPEVLHRGTEEISGHVGTIKGHIRDLYRSVNEYNPHFWRLMLKNPDEAAARKPYCYSLQSEEEACSVISYSLASWIETPGSFDVMRSVSQTA
ncbi:MYND-type zinc finger protein samB [Fusarium falciforme]|uniref:MYND-type zinc finger protein samB n=1 Tax=Fusarium falciforme TaxID=195108 RepID=UPI002300DAA7|nr:MYND-type zinc finger protein samB [Fusarium falciforme]WAO90097.1 MYND-type zinc finger protein samB [Fusarium falciforme]